MILPETYLGASASTDVIVEVYRDDVAHAQSFDYYDLTWHRDIVWTFVIRPLIKIGYAGTEFLPADFDLQKALNKFGEEVHAYGDLPDRPRVATPIPFEGDEWERIVDLASRIDCTPEAIVRTAFIVRCRQWNEAGFPFAA